MGSRWESKLTFLALIVYALGSALPVFTMSLVKSSLIALAHSDVQDFSIVMLTKTLGILVGAPLMTVLWVQAIKLGGVGVGLPYFVSAVSNCVKKRGKTLIQYTVYISCSGMGHCTLAALKKKPCSFETENYTCRLAFLVSVVSHHLEQNSANRHDVCTRAKRSLNIKTIS